MSGELEAAREGLLVRGIATAWDRLAPLSAGAVAGGAVLVAASTVLRRMLGARHRGVLSWAAIAIVLPLGLWLLAEVREEDSEPVPRKGAPELGERETTIVPEV